MFCYYLLYCNLIHLFLLSDCLGDTWLTLSLLSPCLVPLPSHTSYLSSTNSSLPSPACLGDTWLGLSLILGRLFPADQGFA